MPIVTPETPRKRLLPPQSPKALASLRSSSLEPSVAIGEELEILETWAKALISASYRHLGRYWLFKVPAVLLSLTSPLLRNTKFENLIAVFGVVAAALVALDGLWPGGQLYVSYRRAAAGVRRLEADAAALWRKARLQHAQDSTALSEAASQIIESIATERRQIDQALTDAELATFGASETK